LSYKMMPPEPKAVQHDVGIFLGRRHCDCSVVMVWGKEMATPRRESTHIEQRREWDANETTRREAG
jgi:hypothetical protein